MTRPDVIRVPAAKCLECDNTLNAIGSFDGTAPAPKPGDPVACIRCGAVMTFEAGALRGFTETEMDELIADTEAMDELARMVKGIHFVRTRRN
jgi:hypothetical protein